MTRIVFMGSPEFGIPSLRALSREHSIVGVVTQPDRPAGRGRGLRAPAVKAEARALGLPVIQPEKITEPTVLDQIRRWSPELVVVAAFGQLLRLELLQMPTHGCVNVHASLLPRWRGASPIQAAIAAGDAETGVTIMKMDRGMDTGGIISQRSIPIRAGDTGGILSDKLSALGAELLASALPAYLAGRLQPIPQEEEGATKAPLLKKEDGQLSLKLPAEVLERRVRAYNPWPGAFLDWEEGPLKVHRAHALPGEAIMGLRMIIGAQPALGTAAGILILDEVQPPGKRSMQGRDFLLGVRDRWK